METIESQFNETRKNLFFIVGCPRSGTSLTQYILSMHNDISIPPESWFFNIIQKFFGHDVDLSDPVKFEQVLERFTQDKRWRRFDFDMDRFEELARQAPHTIEGLFIAFGTAWREFHRVGRFGEKSPENYQYMSEIGVWFPEAKFIYIMRDPRATVLSHSKRRGAMRNTYRALRLWLRGERYLRKAAEELGPSRVHMLRYEDLVSDTEVEVKKLCTFLDVTFEECMLKPHEREKKGFLPEQLPFMANTEKPIFKDSIAAWQNELSKAQISVVEYWVGAACLERYGYTPQNPKVCAVSLRANCSRYRYGLSEGLRGPIRRFKKAKFQSWRVKGQ